MREVGSKPGYGILELQMDGQAIPFRCFDGAYPGSFERSSLAEIQPGKAVEWAWLLLNSRHLAPIVHRGRVFIRLTALRSKQIRIDIGLI